MYLIDKLAVAWDWSLNWLIDVLPGELFTKQATLESEAPIPIEIHNNHIYVQAQANRSRPLSFVLDTGADFNALNASLTEELGILQKIEIKPSNAGTGEGTVKLALTRNVRLDLNGVPLRANIFGPLNRMEVIVGRSVDGVLGAQIFYGYVVEIDYGARTISLHNPKTYTYAGQGEIIPLKLVGRRPFINAKIKMPSLSEIEGKFLIDTGDSSGLSLHTPFVQKHDLLSHARNAIPHFTHGIAGESREFLGRMESFQMGGAILQQPVAAFSQAEKGSKADKSYDGAIGGEILRRFKTIFDYSRKQMLLERNADFDRPFDVDMSGTALSVESQNFETIKVKRVFENSPAAEIGLREGDTIVEINGRAAGKLGLVQIEQMFRQDGQEYDLSIRRDEQLLQLKMKTRRLV